MEKRITILTTVDFIKHAHEGQKYGSAPYWTHPRAVMDKGRELFGSKFDIATCIAALLHDVVEDTSHSLHDLSTMGYPKESLDAVALVTKDKALSYDGNIQKIIHSGNRRAMMVKFADNYMNYIGDKSHWPEDKRVKSQKKYRKSMEDLMTALGVKIEIPVMEK